MTVTARQRVAWIAVLAATPLLTLSLIAWHGENIPQWDQWTLVPLFQAEERGELGFDDFWQQSNEHRPVVPKAINVGLAYLTDWDIRVELYLNFAVALAGFLLLLAALRRTLERDAWRLASVVASVVFFSPLQWENWLWGWQLEWFLSNLAAVGVLWALVFVVDRAPRRGFALAAVCALVATFSLGQGLLIWPVGAAILILRRRRWRLWALLGIATYVAYFADYSNAGLTSKTLWLERPHDFVAFVCLYVGRPFGVDNVTGAIAGAILLAAFALCVAFVLAHRDDRALVDRTALWIGVGSYVLAAALITGVSRVSFGPTAGAFSRYRGMAALLAIAVLALLFAIGLSRVFAAALRGETTARGVTVPAPRTLLAAIGLPLLVAGVVNLYHGGRELAREGDQLDRVVACSRTVETPTDPCLQDPQNGTTEVVFPGIVHLRRRGWAGF